MNPTGTLEFGPMSESARLDQIIDPKTSHKEDSGPKRRHGRRLFKRKWARGARRRMVAVACVDNVRLLSAGEERALAELIKAGDLDAEQKLITANLGLVKKAVNDYARCGVPEDDLIQEGNLGLIRATRHFDPSTHTTRFATYATYWIRCFMVRALATNSSLIQRPEKSHLLRAQYRRALDELRARKTAASCGPGSQSPSLDEIAQYLGVAPDRLKQERLTENEQAICQSLGDLTLADGPSPDQDLVKNEDRASVCAALMRLSPFEAWVICERFGLGEPPELRIRLADRGGEPAAETESTDPTGVASGDGERASRAYFQRSYNDMGRECGLSVFRLRQVEQTALDKLRAALAERAPKGT